MSIRRAVVGFACCLALAGCSVIHPRIEKVPHRLDCDGTRDCNVVVTVNCERFYGCAISVDSDLILVTGRDKPIDIRWQLRSDAGAEFAANGIALDSAEFECKAEGKDRFSCRDKHAGFGVFKYSINVTVNDGAFGARGVPSLDPWIVNN